MIENNLDIMFTRDLCISVNMNDGEIDALRVA